MFVKNMESPARLSLLMLFLLLAVQFSVFSYPPWPAKSIGDERHYIGKASHLLEHKKFPRAEGDWRPIGYPVFLALCASIMGNWVGARVICAIVQFVLMAFVLLIFQALACSILKRSYWLFPIAFVLGVQPWTFEDCRNMIPDSLTASLTTLGLLGLFAFIVKKGAVQNIFFFLSGIVLCATLFLRPEMSVMAPILIGGAVLLKQENRAVFLRYGLYAALIFFACLGLQLFYRNVSTQDLKLYGHFSIHKRGAHNWVKSWFSTEEIAYDRFLHGQHILKVNVDAFPKRAFADQLERIEIQKALDLVRSKGAYDEEVDRLFQSVADKRLRDNFFMNSVLTRIWRACMLWLNFESKNRLTMILGPAMWMGKAVIHASYLMRITIILLAGYSFFSALRNLCRGTALWYHHLTVLMFLCVITRTLLMGIVLGWMIDRYALVAWPAMLWCAVGGMIELLNRRQVLDRPKEKTNFERAPNSRSNKLRKLFPLTTILIVWGVIEAFCWLGLIIMMPRKYNQLLYYDYDRRIERMSQKSIDRFRKYSFDPLIIEDAKEHREWVEDANRYFQDLEWKFESVTDRIPALL